jgi:pyridoxamine 5'-phosphate oxidase
MTIAMGAPPNDPFTLFDTWLDEAEQSGRALAEAMALATATAAGTPSVRMVLYRGRSAGGFRFFTNYESRKAGELAANPRAALLFHWAELGRQIRIEGRVERLSDEESDIYFKGRPRGHQLGAWASPQSRPISERAALEARYAELEASYAGRDVPRPPYWGGYRLMADSIEFWQSADNRLHDRVLYEHRDGAWRTTRLAP